MRHHRSPLDRAGGDRTACRGSLPRRRFRGVVPGRVGAGRRWDTFGRVAGVDFDESGNLYVLDTQAARFLVVDLHGNLVRRFGRLGEGPGEFGGDAAPAPCFHRPERWAHRRLRRRPPPLRRVRPRRRVRAADPAGGHDMDSASGAAGRWRARVRGADRRSVSLSFVPGSGRRLGRALAPIRPGIRPGWRGSLRRHRGGGVEATGRSGRLRPSAQRGSASRRRGGVHRFVRLCVKVTGWAEACPVSSRGRSPRHR